MRVREHAWIEKSPNMGFYMVKTNMGAVSYYSNYKDAMSYVNHVNNEDSEGTWFDLPDAPTPQRTTTEEERNKKWELIEEDYKRREEKRKKELKKIEDNRKSKRSNDKYVYIISLIQRGKNGYTEYFQGETNILKMERLCVYKETDAKIFQTKASAQKVVDQLNKNHMVTKLYRNIKVVQKKRELFAKS